MSPANDTTQRTHLPSLTLDQLRAALGEMGEPLYRACQIGRWVFEAGCTSFEEMSDLAKPLRKKLAERFDIYASTIHRRTASQDGTVKLLLQWPDGKTSEAVLIPSETGPTPRNTACISSQVGCPVGCRFCASGLDGLERNLTAGEIVEQALRIRAEARAAGGDLTHVVFMGLGEPLANYPAVLHAVRTINAPWGLNIGARKITISTVGLPKQIRRLAEEGLQINLALSLHAPTDALRQELIPWAEHVGIDELADACREYFDKTGREITLEYILLHGTNDGPDHARALAEFARSLRCNINLLRYNPVASLPFRRPSGEAAHAFQAALRRLGVNSHIRRSRGLDIDAACGQLRRRVMSGEGEHNLVQVALDGATPAAR